MALQRDTISIPLLKGINTKVDPLQEQVGSLVVLKNAKFTKLGNIGKRKGFDIIADQGTVLSDYSLDEQIRIRTTDPLAIRGAGETPHLITKNQIYKYTRANNTLYKLSNYFPMNFTKFALPTDDFLQVNSQSVVYGKLAFHLHTKITSGDLVTYIAIYDISKKTPEVILDQSHLTLNMSGTAFPNSVDGGSTFGAFSHVGAQTANGRLLIHRASLYIFVTDLSGNLFYKHCDPYDFAQISSTAMALGNRDGGWAPVYDGALNSTYNVYDVLSDDEGIIIGATKTTSTDNTNAYKFGDEPYLGWSLRYGWTQTATALGLYRIKDNAPQLNGEVMDGDLAIALVDDNVIYVTTINHHYTLNYEWTKTLTAGINGARFISLIANDNYYNAFPALDPDTTNTSVHYFDVIVSYRKSGDPTFANVDHIPYKDNSGGTYVQAYLTTNEFASGTNDFVREGDWSTVAFSSLEPWAIDYNVVWEFFPDATSSTALISDVVVENWNYGSSIAGRAFQAKWGESDLSNWDIDTVPWSKRSGRWIQPMVKESELQSSFYFITMADYYNNPIPPITTSSTTGTGIKHYSEWCGILAYGIGGGDLETGNGGVPSLSTISYVDNGVIFPYTQQFRVISEEVDSEAAAFTSFYNPEAATLTRINYDESIPNQSQEIADKLFVPGGIVYKAGHGAATEAGFLQAPYRLYLFLGGATVVTEVSTASPVFAKDNIYNYVAVYSARDQSGRVYKSSVSKQLQVTITNTSTNTGYDGLNILVPMNTTTNNTASPGALQVEVYRTTNNGTVFYKVSGQNSALGYPYLYNNVDNAFIVFRDVITDANLTDNELLYTTGGVLENTPAPSCSIMEVYKNIVFMAGLENPYAIQYSKVVGYNTALDFNDSLVIETPTVGGPVTALKGMDDKFFIFKETSIYFIAGGQNNFTSYLRTRSGGVTNMELPILSSDIGCINKNTCVLTPIGIMFKSNRGIYLISRNMQLDYIGSPVQFYNNLTINDSCLYAKEGEVRFITERDDCLIYNYERDLWYTFSQHSGTSNAVIDSEYYFINDTDKLMRESNNFADAGSPIPLIFETGWMSFAKVQGFQRVYRMLILGRYKSAHQLRIKVAYNYDDTWVDEKIVTITDPNYNNPNPQKDIFSSVEYGGPKKQTTGEATGLNTYPSGVDDEGVYGDPSLQFENITAGGGGGGPDEWALEEARSIYQFVKFTGGALGYGTNEGLQYQFRINLKKQKCESIKIYVETIQNTGELEEGATISNLSFLVGVKSGDFKIKQSRVKGTT